MAINTHASIAFWNAALNAGVALLNGGYIEIYSGTQPLTPDTALSGNTRLAKLSISATAFGPASSGVATANAVTAAAALANGTATFYRAFASDDTTAHIDGAVGTSSADMIVANTSLATGEIISVTSWTLAMPVAQ